MKKITYVIIAIFAAITLGCGGGGGSDNSTGSTYSSPRINIGGTLLDADGHSMPDVIVSVLGIQTITNGLGEYVFNNVKVPTGAGENGDYHECITIVFSFPTNYENNTTTVCPSDHNGSDTFADGVYYEVENFELTDGNAAPIANAGPDQNVATGSTVYLDGSLSSDANGDLLNSSWSFTDMPEGSNAALTDPSSIAPSFTADVDGVYGLQLIVNNGELDSVADDVIITAATLNSVPVANAGPDQNVATGSTVTLDGTLSSDADDDPITFYWKIIAQSGSATLSNPFSDMPSFVADQEGTYVIQLVVSDSEDDSNPDLIVIRAATPNSAPVANAGADQLVATGSTVTLMANRSSDADKDPLTYKWSFTSKPYGSSATLSNPSSSMPSFTADRDGAYALKLIVNDGEADSEADSVVVNADSDPSLLFTISGGSSTVKFNDYYQAGSQFTARIKNNSNKTFNVLKTDFWNGSANIGTSSDPAYLSNNDIAPGESVGITWSLKQSTKDNGIAISFDLEDPSTSETFELTWEAPEL